MEYEKPDYLFADALMAALIEAGAFGAQGITFERSRQLWRVETTSPRRFLGYAKTFGEALAIKEAA